MSDNIERIYDILMEQGKTLARISESQENTRAALHFFQAEVDKTNTIVAKHTDQINFWRGSLAVITVMFTSAMAWAGVVISKHAK